MDASAPKVKSSLDSLAAAYQEKYRIKNAKLLAQFLFVGTFYYYHTFVQMTLTDQIYYSKLIRWYFFVKIELHMQPVYILSHQ